MKFCKTEPVRSVMVVGTLICAVGAASNQISPEYKVHISH